MFQSIIQIKLVALAAALGLNTADWHDPSPAMVDQVKNLEQAMDMIQKGDAAQVQSKVQQYIGKINELADGGDKDAQYAMGFFFQNQQGGVPKAMEYYAKAANQGQLQAENNLGFLTISQGNQLPEKERAAKWAEGVALIQKAADAGNDPARRNMAQLHLSGQAGVKQDVDAARKLLETAVKDRDDQAEFELFQYYAGNAGKDKIDVKEAQKWLEKAADDGNAQGLDTLGTLMLSGKVGPIEVKKDESAAVKMFKKLADKDNPVGLRKMAGIYEEGLFGESKDYEKAVADYQKAARGNDGVAQVRLASMLDTGWDPDKKGKAVVSQNDAAALSLYKLAVQNKIPLASYNVGVFYEQGRSVDKDLAKAFTYYLQAAEAGFVLAMQKVGVYYSNGAGVTKDPVAAAGWFQRASASGLPEASLALGIMYEQGAGPVERDQNPYSLAAWAYNEVVMNPKASDQVVAEALLRLGGLSFRGVTRITPEMRTPDPDYSKAYEFFQQAVDLVKDSDVAKRYRDAAKEKLSHDQIKAADATIDQAKLNRESMKKKAQDKAQADASGASAPVASKVIDTPPAATPVEPPATKKKKKAADR